MSKTTLIICFSLFFSTGCITTFFKKDENPINEAFISPEIPTLSKPKFESLKEDVDDLRVKISNANKTAKYLLDFTLKEILEKEEGKYKDFLFLLKDFIREYEILTADSEKILSSIDNALVIQSGDAILLRNNIADLNSHIKKQEVLINKLREHIDE